MRYFVDTEFNGFGGTLISVAAVPEDASSPAFYEAIDCSDPTSWIIENVLPVLQTNPRPVHEVRTLFSAYLADDPNPVIVADWPEDIAHVAALLTNGEGRRLVSANVVFHLLAQSDFSSERESKVPHNALHDAIALRDWAAAQGGS
jgi:hypothetical protein